MRRREHEWPVAWLRIEQRTGSGEAVVRRSCGARRSILAAEKMAVGVRLESGGDGARWGTQIMAARR